MIVASRRDVATLVRFAPTGSGRAETFGFEISVPGAIDELGVRAKAYAMYRALRKSGIAWEMWRRRPERPHPRPVLVTAERATVATPSALEFVSRFILGSLAIVLAITLLAAAPRTVTLPLAFVVVAGLIAIGAIVLADRWTERRRRNGVVASVMRRAREAVGSMTGEAFVGRRFARQVSAHALGRLAVAVLAIALLGAALVVPEVFGVALSLAGFAGLFALRLTATKERRQPRGARLRDWRSTPGTVSTYPSAGHDESEAAQAFAADPNTSRTETARWAS